MYSHNLPTYLTIQIPTPLNIGSTSHLRDPTSSTLKLHRTCKQDRYAWRGAPKDQDDVSSTLACQNWQCTRSLQRTRPFKWYDVRVWPWRTQNWCIISSCDPRVVFLLHVMFSFVQFFLIYRWHLILVNTVPCLSFLASCRSSFFPPLWWWWALLPLLRQASFH